MTLAIIGHSFIKCIQSHPLLWTDCVDLHILWLSGASTTSLLESDDLIQLMLFKSKRVFIQIEGNDINKLSKAEDVFYQIKNFVSLQTSVHGVKEVIVGSLFRRFQPRGVDYREYEKQRVCVNELLSNEYKDSDNVFFWKLRGLVNTENDASISNILLINQ